MNNAEKINIIRYKAGLKTEIEDMVVSEKPLNIYINNQFYASLMCTPCELIELGIGFIRSEGIIVLKSDIKNVELKSEDMLFINLKKKISTVSGQMRARISGCGKGSIDLSLLNEENLNAISSNYTFIYEDIIKYMKDFNNISDVFKTTGGVHSSCICGNKGIEIFSEDIGRHNAVDKIIGKCLLNNIELESKMIFTTGRISSDILIKIARAGASVLVSHSGPTDLAIKMARNLNITLIGFVRGDRMNIYCGFERLSYVKIDT